MKKLLRILFYISFIIYVYALIYILILSRRQFNNGVSSYIESILLSSNFIPFKTIFGYLSDIVSNNMSTGPVFNLLGNLIMCFPLGVYLTVFLKKKSNFKFILISSTFIIFLLEFIQIILKRGHFDIDDLILNVMGACLGYLILQNKYIINIIKIIFGKDFYESNRCI